MAIRRASGGVSAIASIAFVAKIQQDLQQMDRIGPHQQGPFVAFRMQDNLSVIGLGGKNAQCIRNHRIEVDLLKSRIGSCA